MLSEKAALQLDALQVDISIAVVKMGNDMVDPRLADNLEYQDFIADMLIRTGDQLKRVNESRRINNRN